MIDVSTDALDWIVREPAIPYTKVTPHTKEIKTRIAHIPHHHDIARAATFAPLGRNPANMLLEME